jgi:hypothetical protein
MLVPTSKRPLSPSAEALLTLPLDACRWPVGGPRWWCGKPATCGSYCTEHDRDKRNPEIKPRSPRTSGPTQWGQWDRANRRPLAGANETSR